MRTQAEIAKDLAEARQSLIELLGVNVYGVSVDRLAELEARKMNLDRRIFLLKKERTDWVER